MLVEPLEARRLLNGALDTPVTNAGAISPATASPTVTYTLSINDDGTGHYAAGEYAIYAADNSSSTNLGIADFSVNVTGYDTLNQYAPYGTYDDGLRNGGSYELGFTTLRTLNASEGVSAFQDIFSFKSGGRVILVSGFGQTAGNLTALAYSDIPHTTGLINGVQEVYGNYAGNYAGMVEVANGTYTGTPPAFTASTTYDTAQVLSDLNGDVVSANTAETTVTLPQPPHTALLTITATSSSSLPAYLGTGNPGGAANASTITLSHSGTGKYVPGMLNDITTNQSQGAVVINGFVNNDTEIIAAALTVTDGNGTQAPTAQELSDIIADLNKTVNQTLPNGATATVEAYAGTSNSLQSSNADVYDLLNYTDGINGGQPLELAVMVKGVSPQSIQTFGMDFSNETADDMTAVNVTDIGASGTVAIAPTATVVTTSNSTPTYGQPVTFAATVTPTWNSGETGTVQFQIDGSNVGSPVTLSGNAASYTTSDLTAGSHSVVAVYSGDSNFSGSTAPVFMQNVSLAAPAYSNLSAASTITYGAASVTFSGTITASTAIPPTTEFVAITLNGVTLNAAISSNGNFASTFNTSNLPPPQSPYQVAYTYAGNADFSSITDRTTTQLTVIPGTTSIAGTIYSDLNDSGVWNSADPELNDVMVYLDANNNGTLDAGEISVNTGANGNYLFSNLAPGTYAVREVAPGGYVQTYPSAGYISVTVASGQAITGQTFLDAPAGHATEQAVYRLYSPVTLEHLYTTDPREYNTLESYVGTWNGEGQVFSEYNGPATVGGVADEPYYRLYNPFVLQHLWTTDSNEYTVLATEGWNQEGIVGYVFPVAPGSTATSLPTVPNSQALYRMMAPQVHLWTTSLNEYDTLATEGWTGEGIIGYVL